MTNEISSTQKQSKPPKSYSHPKIAPALDLNVPSLLSVEYPLKVKNTNKAIEMIGGQEKLKHCFIEPDMKLELRLRPKDPLSHPIHSSVIKNSNNVLLKLKIPKRILKLNNKDIRKSIEQCENEGIKYEIEPFGILKQNYKFRELADFQKITKNSEFNKKFNESIRSGNCEKIDEFANELKIKLDETQEFKDGDLDLPSLVRYSRENLSHNYKYFGNLLLDEQGEWLNKSVKLYSIQIKWDDPVPTKYDPKLDIEYEKAQNEIIKMKESKFPDRIINESVSYHLIECVKILKKLFELKPIWIRKHIHWLLPKPLRSQLRFALPFVTYTFKKGPWRHSFIKLGYDPRKDPKAMGFQIEAFRGINKVNYDAEIEKSLENDGDVYIIPPSLYEYIDEFSNKDSEINKLGIGKIPRQLFFDGSNPCNSLSFQIGDIMDKDIKKIIDNCELEPVCHKGSGWLNWLVMSKIKSIMKYKLSCIREGVPISRDKVHDLMNRTVFTKGITAGLKSDDDEDDDDEDEDDDDDEEEEEGENGEDEENENGDNEEEVEQSHNGLEGNMYEENDNRNGDHKTDSSNKVNKIKEIDFADDDIIKRLEKLNPKSSNIIHELDNIIKQETLMANQVVEVKKTN